MIRFLICSVSDTHYLNAGSSWIRFTTVYSANSIGLESLTCLRSTQSDDPSFQRQSIFHPFAVFFGIRRPRFRCHKPIVKTQSSLVTLVINYLIKDSLTTTCVIALCKDILRNHILMISHHCPIFYFTLVFACIKQWMDSRFAYQLGCHHCPLLSWLLLPSSFCHSDSRGTRSSGTDRTNQIQYHQHQACPAASYMSQYSISAWTRATAASTSVWLSWR